MAENIILVILFLIIQAVFFELVDLTGHWWLLGVPITIVICVPLGVTFWSILDGSYDYGMSSTGKQVKKFFAQIVVACAAVVIGLCVFGVIGFPAMMGMLFVLMWCTLFVGP